MSQRDNRDQAGEPANRHRRVAAWCAAMALSMAALSFASVPLYRMFCQVTGYGGTTQRAAAPSHEVLNRMITVRFDANVGPGLSWTFEPIERTREVRLGENVLVKYRATNTSDRRTSGTATFNVTPEIAGVHFNKIECFCFKEQTLEPGQSVEMPVSFFVDPALAGDRDAAFVTQITLSYTFYPTSTGTPAAAVAVPADGKGG